MTFKDLNITESILKAIEEKGYVNPTPIQAKAIPALLVGKDISVSYTHLTLPTILRV